MAKTLWPCWTAHSRKERPGGEVHDVVLVDPGRGGEQRDGVHLCGLRGVLDEFDQVVAEHHLPGGGGEVAPDLEPGGVDLAGPAAVVEQVVEEVAGAGEQAAAAGAERGAQGGRVGEQVVGRGECVGEELPRQAGLRVGLRVARAGGEQVVTEPSGRVIHRAGGDEGGVAPPGLVREAAVPGRVGRLGAQRHRRDGGTGLGQLQVQPRHGRCDLHRIRGGAAERRHQGPTELGRIEIHVERTDAHIAGSLTVRVACRGSVKAATGE
jgi:hypothetical protein